MTNLRNPHVRIRDIRKLVSLKSQFLVWDHGFDDKNEWVFASTENERCRQKLVSWLTSKNVDLENEAILIRSTWTETKKIVWSDLLTEPDKFFNEVMFEIYDIELNWCLEYQIQQVARFGRYSNRKKA